MSSTNEIVSWSEYFKEFSGHNIDRPVKLEIFGGFGVLEEASQIPFAGIAVELTGENAPRVGIMLGERSRHLTHTILQVTRIWTESDDDGLDRAVVFESMDGAKTLLTFISPIAESQTA